jgi:hypothetical protein
MDLNIALDYILVEIVLLYNHTLILNKIGKDFKKTDKKLFLKILVSLFLSIINIITKTDLDNAIKEIIKVI